MGTILTTGALLALIAYQVFVTIAVLKADQYSPRQRIVQTFLIWVVPLVGAAVCHVVLFTDRQPSTKRDDRFTPATDENPPGIGQDALHR
jgi:hypothetical protein